MTILKHNTPSAEAKSPCNIFESISKRGRKKLGKLKAAALGALGLLGAEQAMAGTATVTVLGEGREQHFYGNCDNGGGEVTGDIYTGEWSANGPRGIFYHGDMRTAIHEACPDAPSSTGSASSGVESKKNRQKLLAMVESRLLQGKRLGLTAEQVLESIAKENGDDSWIFINEEKGCPRTREESAEIMLQIGWSFNEVREFLRICGEKTEDLNKWISKNGNHTFITELDSKRFFVIRDRDQDGKTDLESTRVSRE